MMRTIIPITVMFSLIGSFAGFTLVALLTNGGPVGAGAWHVVIPRRYPAAISRWVPRLFLVPILAVAATFILRGIARRGS